MLIVISPAKSLDFETPAVTNQNSQSAFLKESVVLNKQLRKLQITDLSSLMKISPKLAELNYDRNQEWAPPFTPENAKQALLAFRGDVYQGLDADSFDTADFEFAQDHLRILSGLYGMLKPLDLMQPYRLEMGTKLTNKKGKNLYEFWDNKITDAINDLLVQQEEKVLVNLASNEYFKVIKPKLIQGEVITPVFKDFKNGQYKIISFFAKKARGMMSRYIIQNKVQKASKLKHFDLGGYTYNDALSEGNNWVFTREENQTT